MTWLRRRWPIALALVLVYLDDDANPYRAYEVPVVSGPA